MSNAILEDIFGDICRMSREELNRFRFVSALYDLVLIQPIEEISVQDLCDYLGVSRQMFYRTFSEKYDIIRWFWLKSVSRFSLQVGRKYNWYESLELHFMSNEKSTPFFARCGVLGKNEMQTNSVKSFAIRTREESLIETITDYLHVPMTDKLLFEIKFFAIAEAETLIHIVSTIPLATPKILAEYTLECVPTTLCKVIDDGMAELA